MDPRPVSQVSHDTQFQATMYAPVPVTENEPGLATPLSPPNPQFASYQSSTRDSYASAGPPSANNSALRLTEKPEGQYGGAGTGGDDDGYAYNDRAASVRSSRVSRRKRMILLAAAAIGGIALIVTAITVPVVLVTRNNNKSSDNNNSNGGGSNGGSSGDGGSNTPQAAITGGDGSEVTMEDGTTFTYSNKFGGYWVSDPDNPWNDGARPNSWTPPLNTSWDYSRDRIYGVNLGGLFVLEPFISPALFEKYSTATPQAVDEWTLSQAMAADTSPGGGLDQLEEHYRTFITERDIAQIAGAGLNWVRLPVPFWAIETWPGEPFLEKVCWQYILKVFAWCRKYGIRIKLDLHAVPGSQNVWNHSGKEGQQNFLNGVMGLANAERTLGYIRVFTEFISQPEYRNVVPMFGVMNEPQATTTGLEPLQQFYHQVYTTLRDITGTGEGNGPVIAFHDGFAGLGQWSGFLAGADRIAIDHHPYFAFTGGAITPVETFADSACDRFQVVNGSVRDFGVTVAGEWSVAINSCAMFLNGVGGTSDYQGDCAEWESSAGWTQATKDALRNMALASMDGLRDYFFWTWKIGNSTVRGNVAAPFWSYQLGLAEGYIPDDPRDAVGFCASRGLTGAAAPATLSAWQTGGVGAGTLVPAPPAATTAWPPTSIAGVGEVVSLLPTFTQTGPIPTLPAPTLTGKAASAAPTPVDGWFNDADTAGNYVTVAGCTYPMAWDAVDAAIPAAACTGAGSPTGVLTSADASEETTTTDPLEPTTTEAVVGAPSTTFATLDESGVPTVVTLRRREPMVTSPPLVRS